jgi:hypothetical protein
VAPLAATIIGGILGLILTSLVALRISGVWPSR